MALYADLCLRHDFCADVAWPECLYQCAGIPADRYADDAVWRRAQSGAGSCFYFRAAYGRGRCGAGDGVKPGGVLYLGAVFFDRKKGAASHAEAESADRRQAGGRDHGAGHVGFYHAGDELSCAGGVQCDA